MFETALPAWLIFILAMIFVDILIHAGYTNSPQPLRSRRRFDCRGSASWLGRRKGKLTCSQELCLRVAIMISESTQNIQEQLATEGHELPLQWHERVIAEISGIISAMRVLGIRMVTSEAIVIYTVVARREFEFLPDSSHGEHCKVCLLTDFRSCPIEWPVCSNWPQSKICLL